MYPSRPIRRDGIVLTATVLLVVAVTIVSAAGADKDKEREKNKKERFAKRMERKEGGRAGGAAINRQQQQQQQLQPLLKSPFRILEDHPAVDCLLSVGDWGSKNADVQSLAKGIAEFVSPTSPSAKQHSDSGSGTSATKPFCKSVVACISLGDMVYSEGATSATDPAIEGNFQQFSQYPALQVPWVMALGNHDYNYRDSNGRLVPPNDRTAKFLVSHAKSNPLWVLPGFDFVHDLSLDGFQVRLIVADSPHIRYCAEYPTEAWCVGEPHLARFKQALEEAHDNSTIQLVILVTHHPICTGAPHQYMEYNQKIWPLIRDAKWNKLVLFLAGDNHFVAVQQDLELAKIGKGRDLHYVTNGGGLGVKQHACQRGTFKKMCGTHVGRTQCQNTLETGSFTTHRIVKGTLQPELSSRAGDGAKRNLTGGMSTGYLLETSAWDKHGQLLFQVHARVPGTWSLPEELEERLVTYRRLLPGATRDPRRAGAAGGGGLAADRQSIRRKSTRDEQAGAEEERAEPPEGEPVVVLQKGRGKKRSERQNPDDFAMDMTDTKTSSGGKTSVVGQLTSFGGSFGMPILILAVVFLCSRCWKSGGRNTQLSSRFGRDSTSSYSGAGTVSNSNFSPTTVVTGSPTFVGGGTLGSRAISPGPGADQRLAVRFA